MSDLNEKLNALATKLGINRDERTPDAPAPDAPAPVRTTAWTEGQSGATVNWDEYDLDTAAAKMYRRARYHEGEWLMPYFHYKTLNLPVARVAEALEQFVNDEDWKLLSIQSNGSGMQAITLTRTTMHPLGAPRLLQDLEPLAVDEEAMHESTDRWVNEQKGSE